MSSTTTDGTGDLVCHNSLVVVPEVDVCTITVNNNIAYGPFSKHRSENPKKLELKVLLNMTVWDLKKIIAKNFCIHAEEGKECDPVMLKLERESAHSAKTMLRDSDNGRMIRELGFCSGTDINVTYKTESSNLRKQNVIFSDGALTPEALELFRTIFEPYQTDGLMSPEQFCGLLKFTTGQDFNVTHSKPIQFFKDNDKDKDGFISFEEFCAFYQGAAENKLPTVYTNIGHWKYNHEFRPRGEKKKRRDPNTLL